MALMGLLCFVRCLALSLRVSIAPVCESIPTFTDATVVRNHHE